MADRKITTKKSTRPQTSKKTVLPEEKQSSWFSTDFFRFGESYSSLVLGIVVVIAVAALLVSFARTTSHPKEQETSSTSTQAVQQETNEVAPGETYTVEAGDDLWKIAEQAYHDGYMWEKIAAANKLTDPSQLTVGMKLQIPQSEVHLVSTLSPTITPSLTASATPTVTPTIVVTKAPTITAVAQKTPTPTITGTQTTTGPPAKIAPGSTYTVVAGDTLWDIAVQTYGSGYRWVDIARANHQSNPDLIYPGDKFQLPK